MSKWTFIEHITDYLQRPRFGDPRHPTLWPSEASAVVKNEHDEEVVHGACRRASFFRYVVDNYKFYDKYSFYKELVGELELKKIKPDRYMLWIWKAGELYEEYVIQLAKEAGVYIADQAPIYIKEFNVSGKRDLVVINPETRQFRTVEVKSIYGFNSTNVLGTPASRKKGKMGDPRTSNLMQIALYDWWGSSHEERFEHSSLLYGARDTGRYGEFEIRTVMGEEGTDDEGTIFIEYRAIAPIKTSWTRSPVTINNILAQYEYVQNCVDSGEIPKRDFELHYSEERIQQLYERGELGKTDTERHEKWLKWKAGESTRKIKPVEKDDWQCRFCKWKNVCYDEDGKPKEL